MKLPVFELVINPDESSDAEVSFVALVDKPAIEKNFLAFNAIPLQFAVNEEKRIISGPAMVAESLIYRRDEQGEYNVFFSAATIKEIALKFFKKDYQKNLNLFHDPSLPLNGVTIFESFISDKERGIQPMKGFEDLPDGSWFISAKVENDEVWAKIKSGEVKGFSVEGIFSYVKKQKTMEEQIAELLNATLPQNSHFNKSGFMNEVQKLVSAFRQKFFGPEVPPAAPAPAPAPAQPLNTDYQLKDGTPVSISELAEGGVVLVGEAPAPAGEHELADGTKLTVGEGGVITSVTPAVAAAAPAAPTDYSKEFSTINEKFAGYEQKFAAYEEKFKQQEEAIQRAMAMNEKLFAVVEKLAEMPTADPVTTNNSFSSAKETTKAEKLKALAEGLKNLKNK